MKVEPSEATEFVEFAGFFAKQRSCELTPHVFCQ